MVIMTGFASLIGAAFLIDRFFRCRRDPIVLLAAIIRAQIAFSLGAALVSGQQVSMQHFMFEVLLMLSSEVMNHVARFLGRREHVRSNKTK